MRTVIIIMVFILLIWGIIEKHYPQNHKVEIPCKSLTCFKLKQESR